MDLPDRFTVDVSAEDIARGDPTFFGCPLARALKRVCGPDGWSVSEQRAYRYANEMTIFTHDAGAWVKAFDNDKPVSPCTVTLTRVEST